jgi:GNAT superfamily N-acetyltransferase
MKIQADRAEYADVQKLRELYRQELNCQIIRDSFLARGLADPYLIQVDGRIAGYGAISNKYDKGRIVEFHTLPHVRSAALQMFRELLAASKATHVEAQTNAPLMMLMLIDCATNVTAEKVLFRDAFITNLASPGGQFRPATPQDFRDQPEPGGDWVIELDGKLVAWGGFLTHYNPPYGDLYMEVAQPTRQQGFGSFLLQEVKKKCYEAGLKPAARCNADNAGSRRTLEKAGMLPCGHLLFGEVKSKNG